MGANISSISGSPTAVSRGRTGLFPARLADRAWLPLVLVVALTILYRSQHFGSPDIDFDEPFYLLVGERMVQGALPYVDIWDRKPIGLFLIYAAAALPGGNPFLNYQLVAAACAAATAAMVWRIAGRWVGPWTAMLPALVYVLWQTPYRGDGGQAAIFYNLLTAGAFWQLLRAADSGCVRRTRRSAYVAMALLGCAIQVKYTVLPEGMLFGCCFLFLAWRQGASIRSIVALALACMAIAVAPTVLAAAYYAAAGHLDAFVYANFTSVFDRLPLRPGYVRSNLIYIGVIGAPLALGAFLGLRRMSEAADAVEKRDGWLLGLWLIAAVVGFSMISNFYYYYFMPVLLPLSIACTAVFRVRPLGPVLAAALLVQPVILAGIWNGAERDKRIASIDALTKLVSTDAQRGCMFIYDGPAALYVTSKACIPTRFAYPDHLSNDVERTAIGVDTIEETRRILASRPAIIVTSPIRVVPIRNAMTTRMVKDAIARDYRFAGSVMHKQRPIDVYRLRTLPPSTPPEQARR